MDCTCTFFVYYIVILQKHRVSLFRQFNFLFGSGYKSTAKERIKQEKENAEYFVKEIQIKVDSE
jgi:hypothetical protein